MLDRPKAQIEADPTALPAPLVMLPGTLCDARVFQPVLDQLGIDAVVPPLEGATSAAEMARRLLEMSPDRMSLLGFSLGAIVALEMVAQAPGRVERLALVGANAGVRSKREQAARAALAKDDFIADDDPPLARRMAQDASEGAWRDQTAITINRQDSRPRLPRIGVPTLVLCGADDPICPPSMSREIAAAIPGAVLAVIDDAGHYVTLDQPALSAAHIAAWLATPGT